MTKYYSGFGVLLREADPKLSTHLAEITPDLYLTEWSEQREYS